MHAMTLALTLAQLALGAVGDRPRGAPPRPAPGAAAEQAEVAAAARLTDQQVKDRVRAYLGAIHGGIPADRWRALGKRGEAALEEVARDPDALPTQRVGAVAALTKLGGARARRTSLDLARDEAAPGPLRDAAVRAAGHLVAAKELPAQLRPVLERSGSPEARAAAAEVLSTRAPAACASVRAQAAREAGEARAPFDRAVRRCQNVP